MVSLLRYLSDQGDLQLFAFLQLFFGIGLNFRDWQNISADLILNTFFGIWIDCG